VIADPIDQTIENCPYIIE